MNDTVKVALITTAGVILVGMMANKVGPFHEDGPSGPESPGSFASSSPQPLPTGSPLPEDAATPAAETTPPATPAGDGPFLPDDDVMVDNAADAVLGAETPAGGEQGQLLVENACTSSLDVNIYVADAAGSPHVGQWAYGAGDRTRPTFQGNPIRPREGQIYFYARRADGWEWRGDQPIQDGGTNWPMRSMTLGQDEAGRYLLKFTDC
ncbi:MAG: hypothetical protein ABW042_12110 [Phenylobacterium sp.]